MMTLDLKDAYYALPILTSHRKYTRFIYQDRTHEFQCVPFGLSTASQAFTKTLKPVLAVLLSLGCDLHRRHVITPPREQGVLENLCSSGRSSGKAIPCPSNLSRSCLRFHNNDTVPPLTQPYHQCGLLSSPLAQGSGSMKTLSTFIREMSHASQCGTLFSLERSSTPTPASSVTSRACQDRF